MSLYRDTLYAKGKAELRRNKPPRFSLKTPVVFVALKGKRAFILLVPTLPNREPPSLLSVLRLHSLMDSLWLSLAVFQWSQHNCFRLLVSVELSMRLFA